MTPAALLPFPPGCRAARFLRREKRFFVIAELDGKIITAHTNNTGSMLGMLRPGAPVLLSPATTPGRKLAWTVEAIGQPGGTPGAFFWAGVNTSVPNRFLEAAFRAHLLPWTEGYDGLKREAACGESRLDGLFTSSDASLPPLWVECKNVTLVEDCVAAFPDAITARGAKHLATLHGWFGKAAGLPCCIWYRDRTDSASALPTTSIPHMPQPFTTLLRKGWKSMP